MKNGYEKPHGDGLNSKRKRGVAALSDCTVFHEPVKDKPPCRRWLIVDLKIAGSGSNSKREFACIEPASYSSKNTRDALH